MSLKVKYFVLKPKSNYPGDIYAKASRMAMQTYAAWIQKEDPDLAREIAKWARDEEVEDLAHCETKKEDAAVQ